MDEARRFIANETDRDEDIIEKADTALIGLVAQLLDTAGRAAEALLSHHGFGDRIEYRYASKAYFETITAVGFQ